MTIKLGEEAWEELLERVREIDGKAAIALRFSKERNKLHNFYPCNDLKTAFDWKTAPLPEEDLELLYGMLNASNAWSHIPVGEAVEYLRRKGAKEAFLTTVGLVSILDYQAAQWLIYMTEPAQKEEQDKAVFEECYGSLDSMFCWEETPQGSHFWSALEDKLEKIYGTRYWEYPGSIVIDDAACRPVS